MAFPIDRFEPLRTPRGSPGARHRGEDGEVVIRWDALGPTRDFRLPGKVSAVVRLRADRDGRSVVASCEVTNGMDRPIPQVIFPDLAGPAARGGPAGHRGANALGTRVPRSPSWSIPTPTSSTCRIRAGGTFENSRWIDFGGLQGGLSLFARRWGWDPQVVFMLSLDQATRALRLLTVHAAAIAPGQTWSSGEFVLTPHASGWAKGIEPYRAWVEAR